MTFGRVSRLGYQVPRATRPVRRDIYTAQLEERLSQETEARRQESEAANLRIASLEKTQKEMQDLLAALMRAQHGGGDDDEGSSDDDAEGGSDDGTEGGSEDDDGGDHGDDDNDA